MNLVKLLPVALVVCACATIKSEPRHSGLYVFGHEAHLIRLCGDTKTYWVRASPRVADELRARHDSLTNRPYQPVYVEIKGEVSDRPTAGFAADYDGYFEIEKVVVVREARANDCRMAEFRNR